MYGTDWTPAHMRNLVPHVWLAESCPAFLVRSPPRRANCAQVHKYAQTHKCNKKTLEALPQLYLFKSDLSAERNPTDAYAAELSGSHDVCNRLLPELH